MENGFFKWVWRFNAVVIAFAALGIVFLLSTELWRSYSHTRHATQVVNVDEQDVSREETFSYGSPSFDSHTKTMVVPLYISQEYDMSGGYFSSSSRKGTSPNLINQLLVEPLDGSHRWLFPDNTQLVISQDEVARPLEIKQQNRKVVARLYEIVAADNNGDKRLSYSDTKTLIITKPDYSGLTELITGYDDLVATNHPDNAHFEVLINTGGIFTLYRFSTQTYKQTSKFDLPTLPTSR